MSTVTQYKHDQTITKSVSQVGSDAKNTLPTRITALDVTNQQSIDANESVSTVEKIFREKVSKTLYPDFRYSCHYCGTLDVFIKLSKSKGIIEIDCLDCKKVWTDNVNEVKTTRLCHLNKS